MAGMYTWAPVWVGESRDYIGFVYQFGVKGMRARKHVQYQFRVDGRHVQMDIILGWRQ